MNLSESALVTAARALARPVLDDEDRCDMDYDDMPKERTDRFQEYARAAYPAIRADVIAEVVAALRGDAGTLYRRLDGYGRIAADFIEQEFGA